MVRKVDVRTLAPAAAGRASGFALLRLALVGELAHGRHARFLAAGEIRGKLVGDVKHERIVEEVVCIQRDAVAPVALPAGSARIPHIF